MTTETINCNDVTQSEKWTAYNGDSCEVYKAIPSDSVGFYVYSPPFESLYQYSDNLSCLGNSASSEEFFEHYGYLVKELYRTLMPGRCCSVHCMQLPKSKQRDGVIGLRDFRGNIIRCHEQHGFIYHSEVCIWKDPVVAMQRTKAIGLLHKQLVKDSAMSRQGIADYVVTFRKPGVNPKPINGPLLRWAGDGIPFDAYQFYLDDMEAFEAGNSPTKPKWEDYMGTNISIELWQRYASPVWMDIKQGNVLNNFTDGSDGSEVRHLCPLQGDVIERCLMLWSRPDDLVSSPFLGIGSEGYHAVRMGRDFFGCELKDSYYRVAVQNLRRAESELSQGRLFE